MNWSNIVPCSRAFCPHGRGIDCLGPRAVPKLESWMHHRVAEGGIFSVAVLEHLADLPFTLARAALLLREGGSFGAGFPSKGGLLWGLAWRLTTEIEYRLKRCLDYGAIMRHEHLNTAAEILALLRYFYEHVESSRFPCPLHPLSFYTMVIATKPLLDRCQQLDALRSGSKTFVHE